MRNLIVGLLVLAAGAYYLSGNAPGISRGSFAKPSGNISGYVGASKGSLSATKGAAGAILK